MNQTELPECEKINKKEPSKDVQMTQEQADRLVEHLKNVFMYVRVLRPDEIGDFIIDEENGKLCECYAVWNKAMPCLNCISEKALREKSQKSKLECIASNVYQVIARYVEIEGEPCVIEMINRLDDETLMDSEGRQNLVSKLNSYSEELYRDALTGVFNRRYFEDQILGCQDDVVRQENRREKQRILIVDDSEMNRIILSEILQDEYDIIEASTGEECLRLLEEYGTGLALILLDIVMPGMDGFGVLDYMNRNHWIEEVPVIMISSEDSTAFVRRAYEQGVSDYISRPFDAKVVYQRVFNTIKLYAKQRRLVTLVTEQIYEKEKNNQMMISILSHIMEFRNGESGLHVHHINVLTSMLLERLVQKTDRYHLSWSDQLMITTASALHDIGKMGIDENILNKPGRLTKEEFEEMKKHTLIGASMLKSLELYQDEKLVQIAYQICRWHHERYDGKGYPDGLKGEEIPIAAQVVSIADVYDALTSERVYKSAYTHEKAIEMILNGECGTFSPLMLECLLDIKDAICEELNTISEEKQTSIQIEKLKKNLKSGGGRAEFSEL